MKALESVLLIFDLDGTLVDSAGDLAIAVNGLLEELGRPPLPDDAVRAMVGEGAGRLMEKVLAVRPVPEASFESVFDRFMALYEALPTSRSVAYPGVPETLDQLAAAGATLAVCTNKPAVPSANLLRDLGLARYFSAVVAGDTLPIRKPDGRVLDGIKATLGAGKATILLIGDSEIDSATATNAGVPFVLMTYGYRQSPPESIPADFRLDRFADLPRLRVLSPGKAASDGHDEPPASSS